MGAHNVAFVHNDEVTIAIILVQPHHCTTESLRVKTHREAVMLFPNNDVIIAWQTVQDEINYFGDEQTVATLHRLDFRTFNWKWMEMPPRPSIQ